VVVEDEVYYISACPDGYSPVGLYTQEEFLDVSRIESRDFMCISHEYTTHSMERIQSVDHQPMRTNYKIKF